MLTVVWVDCSSFKGLHRGSCRGSTIGGIKGNTRTLEYSSYGFRCRIQRQRLSVCLGIRVLRCGLRVWNVAFRASCSGLKF